MAATTAPSGDVSFKSSDQPFDERMSAPDGASRAHAVLRQSERELSHPPVTDGSGGGTDPLQEAPSHDFAFYEWDYEEEPRQPGDVSSTSEARIVSTVSLPGASSSSQHRPSIEDLMGSSIYMSQLSRELGQEAAVALHTELFGNLPVNGRLPRRGRTASASGNLLQSQRQLSETIRKPSRRKESLGHRTVTAKVDPTPSNSSPSRQPSSRTVSRSQHKLRSTSSASPHGLRPKRRARTTDSNFRASDLTEDICRICPDEERTKSVRKLWSRLATKVRK